MPTDLAYTATLAGVAVVLFAMALLMAGAVVLLVGWLVGFGLGAWRWWQRKGWR